MEDNNKNATNIGLICKHIFNLKNFLIFLIIILIFIFFLLIKEDLFKHDINNAEKKEVGELVNDNSSSNKDKSSNNNDQKDISTNNSSKDQKGVGINNSSNESFDVGIIDKKYDKYASDNGRLYVDGISLKNERGEDFRLTGIVLDGNYKENKILHSKQSFNTVKNWGANLVRVFVEANKTYSGQYVYLNNETEYLSYLYEVIDNAIYNDMYVMVVWEPGQDNPMVDKSSEMFTTIAKKYPNDYHIIYEVWNEPQHVKDWNYLKNYAVNVITAIRKISPDSLIVVNPFNMDWVKDDKLNYPNIMYTDHTYAGGMNDESFEKIISAVEAGIPIFETEWAGVTLNSNEIRTYHIKETHATAWIKLLNKYNISYAYFGFKPNVAAYGFTKDGVWDELLPDDILTPNAKFFKKIVSDNYNYEINLMRWNGSKTKLITRDYRSDEWREKIISIDFKTRLEIPSNAVVTWDLSAQQDKSVIGYLVPIDNSDTYRMTICANGKINAPMYSNYLFSGMTNLKSIDFTNFETAEVLSISNMFKNDKSLEYLDLSGFNVSKLENMVSTFSNCSSLKSINFNNWNANVKDIRYAFQSCSKLESLNLNGIDVSDNNDFSFMFDFNTNLKSLDISTWDPIEVSGIKSMFRGCNNIKEINMSLFNIQDTTTINDIFINSSINETVTMIVRNAHVADILKNNISSSIPLNIIYGFGDDSGISGSVNWSYNGSTGALSITGSGEMADYSEGTAHGINIEKI